MKSSFSEVQNNFYTRKLGGTSIGVAHLEYHFRQQYQNYLIGLLLLVRLESYQTK